MAQIVGGEIIGPADASVEITGASIDSRSVGDGELFVPIIAERDGHDFIDAAVFNGAPVTLSSRPDTKSDAVCVIQVDDTQRALTALGSESARRLHAGGAAIVAITGSVGKTSVKDLSRTALGAMGAHASERSFNNELGVPLTLINAPASAGVAVIEMGARGIGHIDHLCSIAQPTIGVVTMIGEVHTSEFGTLDSVAEAKGELLAALPASGTGIINIDSPFATALIDRCAAPVLTYGSSGDLRATDIQLDDQLRPSFVVHAPTGRFSVRLAVSGAHQVSNALASLAIAVALGADLDSAIAGLAESTISPWRMEMLRSSSGALIINDAYNANLISVTAALDALAGADASRRVAVLGTMAELGDIHDQHHGLVAQRAAERGIELIAYGEPGYGTPVLDTFGDVIAHLGPLTAGDAVLVKGSRVAGLERLAALLVER